MQRFLIPAHHHLSPLPGQLTLLFLCLLLAAANANISLGSSLSASNTSSSWQSPNATYSLSFLPSSSSSRLFLAAISFSSTIPIWSAGAAAVDSGASFTLRSDGDLVLLNGSGSVAWSSNTAALGVTSASLLDSGNLLLLNASNRPVWQSFDHPTDTLVAGQNFTTNENLTSDVYSFNLLISGNLTLTWNNSINYFNKGFNVSFTANRTFIAPSLSLQSNGILSLSDASLAAPVSIAYSADYGQSGDVLRFVRLDSDGNFRAYSASRGSSGVNDPTSQWAAVADQCTVFGYCGNMGVCGYNDTSPVCGCPSGNFELIDAANPRAGCRLLTSIQQCPNEAAMLQLDHTEFFTYPPLSPTEQFFIAITACNQNCLISSSCLASTALADGSGLCYLKVSSFVSGYRSAALPSTSFVKVCSPGVPSPPPPGLNSGDNGSSGTRSWVIAVAVVLTLAALVAGEYVLWWVFCRNNPRFGPASGRYTLIEYASSAPVQFSYRELQRSTKGFKEKLGSGGFGAVYRGVLSNRTVVAVKQLEGIEQGEKQFRMEVATISSTHHLNLVRLIGFCSEGRHRLLVYEFMKNGSLDGLLFDAAAAPAGGERFTWAMRFAVAIGTARGITYLHEECRDCIIHCDIKPENILLDEAFNAKVSDFGLAKLTHPKDHRHRTLTSVRGTRGYLAPEWLSNLPITAKSDVYSFGMVLLEIVSGRRNFEVSSETAWKKFSVWAYEEYVNGNARAVLDGRISSSLGGEQQDQTLDMEEVQRAIGVSFWCIQEAPSQRPVMGKVVQMLEGVVDVERPPPPKMGAAPDGAGVMSLSLTGTTTTATATESSGMEMMMMVSSASAAGSSVVNANYRTKSLPASTTVTPSSLQTAAGKSGGGTGTSMSLVF